MASMGARAFLVAMVVVLAVVLPLVQAKGHHAHTPTPAPASAPLSAAPVSNIAAPPSTSAGLAPAPAPVNDGTSIDQGIAYLLMLVALVLTYLIHPLDASPYKLF
ncbi:Arabinogalactan peptide 16 [Nymphaea thermarum]|nr:Arabinogalactan peptide 16 [Nymphaea thermarum]